MVQLLQKTAWHFLKNGNTELVFDPAVPLQDTYPSYLKAGTCTEICMPTFHIHSSIAHNSQTVEATQVSTDGQNDPQKVVYIQWITFFFFKLSYYLF